MAKKKKRTDSEAETEANEPQNEELANGDTHKMKKKLKQKEKKKKIEMEDDESKEIPTVSIAVPGSIIDNAQSYELATRVLPFPLCLGFSWLVNLFLFSLCSLILSILYIFLLILLFSCLVK